jgi:hypothetical protein
MSLHPLPPPPTHPLHALRVAHQVAQQLTHQVTHQVTHQLAHHLAPRDDRLDADGAPLLRLAVAVLLALSALGTAGALLATN